MPDAPRQNPRDLMTEETRRRIRDRYPPSPSLTIHHVDVPPMQACLHRSRGRDETGSASPTRNLHHLTSNAPQSASVPPPFAPTVESSGVGMVMTTKALSAIGLFRRGLLSGVCNRQWLSFSIADALQPGGLYPERGPRRIAPNLCHDLSRPSPGAFTLHRPRP